MWSQYSAMAQHGELGEPVNLRPFSGSRGANRIMTVGAVSASIPIDPSARSIRLVNSGSSICYVRIGQGEQTATSADVAVFGNSEVVLSKGEGEGTLAFISASGTTLQAQTGSGGTVPGYQVVDQLFLTGDGVTQSGQLVDQFGRTVKPVGDASLTRTDWQGTVTLSASPRTNKALQSRTLALGWTATQTAINSDQATAPDGTNTAELIIENTANAEHGIYQSLTGGTSTMSCFFKAAGRTAVYFRFHIGTGNCLTVVYDLAAGVVSQITNQGAGHTGVSAFMYYMGNGWYRCFLSLSKISATTNVFMSLSNSPTPTPTVNGEVQYAGNAAYGVYMWEPQYVDGAAEGGIITTTSAPVTVTDYTLGAGGLITLGEVPVVDAQLKWSGIAIHT